MMMLNGVVRWGERKSYVCHVVVVVNSSSSVGGSGSGGGRRYAGVVIVNNVSGPFSVAWQSGFGWRHQIELR